MIKTEKTLIVVETSKYMLKKKALIDVVKEHT